MRKNLLIGGCVCLLGLAVATNSCAPHEESTPQENTVNDAVMRAREFLELETGGVLLPDTYLRTDNGEPTTRADKKFQGALSIAAVDLEPDWERAVHWKYKGDRVTEVPAVLMRPVKYTTLIEEKGETVSLSVQEPHTRIRVIESPNGKEIFGFVITLLPNENYTGELDDLDSNPVGSDYNGISLYSDLDGTPLWGWRYTDGEIVNTMLFDISYTGPVDKDVNVAIRPAPLALVPNMEIPDSGTSNNKGNDGEGGDEYFDSGTGNPNNPVDISGVTVTGVGPAPTYNGSNDRGNYNLGGGSVLTGGPSGGSKDDPKTPKPKPDPDKPLTDDLFEVDDVDEDKLEDMLEDILIDCMGGALYNALRATGNLTIRFNASEESNFASNGVITLDEYDSGTLFHEMIHAYQYYNRDSSYDGAQANREVEAYIAQYRYEQYNPDYAFDTDWISKHQKGFLVIIKGLSDNALSNKGMLIIDHTDFNKRFIGAAERIVGEYRAKGKGEIIIDDKRSFEQNFKNLTNLSGGC